MCRIIEKYFGEADEFNMKRAFSVYSLLFLLLMSFTYLLFYSAGKGPFQFEVDGLTYFSRIAYIGRYVRSVLQNIFFNKSLSFPVYDFRIGLGDDIFNLLWVGALNPIIFLTAPLFSVEHTEVLYWVICFLNMYFAGLAFILFCSYKKNDSIASACGAIAYIFSGFALFYFLKHFHFITAMIILPTMFWALERALDEERFYPLVLTTAASIIINFYFTFMITIMLLIYGIVRFFDTYAQDRLSIFCRLFCRCAASYLLGVMLAAPFFLPVIFKFMNNERGNVELVVQSGKWLYSARHMLNSIRYLFSPGGTWGNAASMLPICFLAVVCFFRRKMSFERGLKIFLLFFLIGSFSPILTHIFTCGNGAPGEKRWAFIFSFIFSYILVLMFPGLAEWEKEDESFSLVAILLYGILILGLHIFGLCSIDKYILFSLAAIFLAALSFRYAKRHWSIAQRRTFLVLLVLFSSMANVYFLYFTSPINLKNSFGPAKEAHNIYNKNLLPYLAINKIESPGVSSFFRSQTTSARGAYFLLLIRQYDINSYSSLITNYPSYLLELENRAAACVWYARGCDDIASLKSLLSVKYFAAENSGKEAFVPYGFAKVKSVKGCSVFENACFLPLGYTYDSYITQEEYKQYSALEKLEAQLQAVSLEKEITGFERDGAVKFTSKPLQYKITGTDGLEWKNGMIRVNKRNAEMEIKFDPVPSTETYFRLQGLSANDSRDTPAFSYFTISGNKWEKYASVIKNSDARYSGRENYLIRLGTDNGFSGGYLKIIWSARGTFKLDDIQVYAQPMDDYPAQINKLREDVLENIYVGNDRVSGTISLKKNKILCLSIPYSKGWHAKVDGKKAELLKANSLFMALPLEAGDHKIELEYHVPGFRLGLCFFALGAVILSGMIIHDKRKKKPMKENGALPPVQE